MIFHSHNRIAGKITGVMLAAAFLSVSAYAAPVYASTASQEVTAQADASTVSSASGYDVVYVIDNSKSVWTQSEARNEAFMTITEQAKGNDVRVGAVYFADHVYDTLELTSVETDEGAQKVLDFLDMNEEDPDNIDTNIGTALEAANALFDTSETDRQRIVILFSDGINENAAGDDSYKEAADAATETEVAQLKEQNIPIYCVYLQKSRNDEDYLKELVNYFSTDQDYAADRFSKVTDDNIDTLSDTFSDVFVVIQNEVIETQETASGTESESVTESENVNDSTEAVDSSEAVSETGTDSQPDSGTASGSASAATTSDASDSSSLFDNPILLIGAGVLFILLLILLFILHKKGKNSTPKAPKEKKQKAPKEKASRSSADKAEHKMNLEIPQKSLKPEKSGSDDKAAMKELNKAAAAAEREQKKEDAALSREQKKANAANAKAQKKADAAAAKESRKSSKSSGSGDKLGTEYRDQLANFEWVSQDYDFECERLYNYENALLKLPENETFTKDDKAALVVKIHDLRKQASSIVSEQKELISGSSSYVVEGAVERSHVKDIKATSSQLAQNTDALKDIVSQFAAENNELQKKLAELVK